MIEVAEACTFTKELVRQLQLLKDVNGVGFGVANQAGQYEPCKTDGLCDRFHDLIRWQMFVDCRFKKSPLIDAVIETKCSNRPRRARWFAQHCRRFFIAD